MLRLFLIRHAEAFERDRKRWPDDRRRPLTAEGAVRFRKAAAGLAVLVPQIEQVRVSPLVRARQTAALLHEVCDWPEAVEAPELAPGCPPAQALKLIRECGKGRIALVGHEPHLSELLALCIASPGSALASELKKGGAACMAFAREPRPGQAQLRWLLTPKMLRALRHAA